jgi:hypothetical protein
MLLFLHVESVATGGGWFQAHARLSDKTTDIPDERIEATITK